MKPDLTLIVGVFLAAVAAIWFFNGTKTGAGVVVSLDAYRRYGKEKSDYDVAGY